MVFAAAGVMLELKSMRYLSSSMVAVLFEEPFPLCSTRRVLSWLCISCCTRKRQRLKLAAWLQMTNASLADFSHLLNDSWEMRLEAGGVEVSPDCLDILLKQLFSFEDSVFQPETAAGSALWSVASPYHLDCDFAVLRN